MSCGGGLKNRTVDCTTSQGDTVDSEICSKIPQPASQKACNTRPCPECESNADCPDIKVCSSSQCVCPEGYFGAKCEEWISCRGLVSPLGECCASGVVSLDGECCQIGMVQSSSGNCCPAGDVDPCGICYGNNQVRTPRYTY